MNSDLAFVIAHFHEQGRVPANLFSLIEHLRTLTPKVVIVSTGISELEIERLSPLAKVIARENFGYDFWSYKLGIDELGDRSGLSRLVLFNSSFVTLDPKGLCRAFLTPIAGPSLRGITCTAQRGWHAQSYWVAFETAALINSAEFSTWWSQLVPISDRFQVILQQEIGMSNWFAERGVPIRAAFTPSAEEQLIAICRIIGSRLQKITVPANGRSEVSFDLQFAQQLNPTHLLWDSLLERFHLLKIDLLKTNPTFQYLDYFLYSLSRTKPELFDLILDAVPGLRLSSTPSTLVSDPRHISTALQ
jgi:rhamnosyltransferase